MKIKELLSKDCSAKNITIRGWVRTKRGSKNVSFIALNDGSSINNIQIVAEGHSFSEEILKKITTGACIHVEGDLVSSKGEGQNKEIFAKKLKVKGGDDVNEYP